MFYGPFAAFSAESSRKLLELVQDIDYDKAEAAWAPGAEWPQVLGGMLCEASRKDEDASYVAYNVLNMRLLILFCTSNQTESLWQGLLKTTWAFCDCMLE